MVGGVETGRTPTEELGLGQELLVNLEADPEADLGVVETILQPALPSPTPRRPEILTWIVTVQ
jgi:hypothetical protein